MNSATLNTLLHGKWENPDTGLPHTVGIKDIKISKKLIKQSRQLLDNIGLSKKHAIICDENTYKVAGKEIEATLGAKTIILKGNVKPDSDSILHILHETDGCKVLVAVGSGTINDICKYAAFISGRPYAVFGTAPSMNGYTSSNASIIIGGQKKSLQAVLTSGVFLDIDVLADAPERLVKSGLGDSICRSTAQADWLLSHFVLGTEYKSGAFELLKEDEKHLYKNASLLKKKAKIIDKNYLTAIKHLANVLVLSGIGMHMSGGSYPASQGEHMIAHYMDDNKTYHGEQIGVATLTMAKLQGDILKMKKISLSPAKASEIKKYPDGIRAKFLDAAKCERLERNWDRVRAKINEVFIPEKDLRKILSSAGAITGHEDLGWSRKKFSEAVKNAHLTRDRFTFLDLAHHAGILEDFSKSA